MNYFKAFLNKFKKIPVGNTGVSLALMGITNAVLILANFIDFKNQNEAAFNYDIISYITFPIAILLVLIILVKNLAHPKSFFNDLKHQTNSSVSPTIFMSWMLIGGFFAKINGAHTFGVIIWYLSTILHFVYLGFFTKEILIKHDFKTENFYTSWYVPPIGMIVACTVYSPISRFGLVPDEIFYFIWFFGFIMLLLFFPIVVYKTIFFSNYESDKIGLLGIFAAPANLTLSGFLFIFGGRNQMSDFLSLENEIGILIFLSILSISTTIVLYIMLYKIFQTKFNPSYAGLTFPVAISSTSSILSANYFGRSLQTLVSEPSAIAILNGLSDFYLYFAFAEVTIGILIVLYVLIRYYILNLKTLFKLPILLEKKFNRS